MRATIWRRRFLGCCAGLLLPASLVGQALDTSCQAGTGVLPASLKGGGLKIKYDQFTDSTVVATKSDNRAAASMTIVAVYRGQRLQPDSVRLAFLYEERQVQLDNNPVTAANAQYAPESVIYLLLDGKDRLPLARPTYRNKVESGITGLAASYLDERLEFPLTFDQLRAVASAGKVQIKVRAFVACRPGSARTTAPAPDG
jgi:hypothetical protein